MREPNLREPSRFNFWSSTSHGTHLLFNGVSGAMLELSDHERREAESIFDGSARVTSGPIDPCSFEPGDSGEEGVAILSALERGGFLVPRELDEVDALLARTRDACDAQRVFELTISPTYQCNFRCTYCYVDFENDRMTPQVAQRVASFIEAELPRFEHANITWFGGEPLLCLDTVVPLAREIRDLGRTSDVPVLQFLTSNGYLLTKDVACELADAGINYFHITIDGGRAHHDDRRVLAGHRPSFDRVHTNCLDLLATVPDAHLTLRMNVDRENITSVDEVLGSVPAGQRHRVQVHVTPILSSATDRPDRSLLIEVNSAIRRALEMGFSYYDNVLKPARKTFCSADRRGNFQVGPTGQLHKCSPSGKPEVQVGSLGPGGLPVFTERFDTWHDAPLTKDPCLDCPYLCFCAGGCRLLRVRDEPNPGCRDRFADIDQLILNEYLAATSG